MFIYILMGLTLALTVFNLTQVDYNNALEGNSFIALVCSLLSLCALIILLIFNSAKQLDNKIRK
ncbi:MAG: hypothetical protein ACLGH8_16155 [Bacteroidia bacterium]